MQQQLSIISAVLHMTKIQLHMQTQTAQQLKKTKS